MQLKPCYLSPIHFSIAVGDSPEDYFILSWIIKWHLFHETLPAISLLFVPFLFLQKQLWPSSSHLHQSQFPQTRNQNVSAIHPEATRGQGWVPKQFGLAEEWELPLSAKFESRFGGSGRHLVSLGVQCSSPFSASPSSGCHRLASGWGSNVFYVDFLLLNSSTSHHTHTLLSCPPTTQLSLMICLNSLSTDLSRAFNGSFITYSFSEVQCKDADDPWQAKESEMGGTFLSSHL